MLHVAFCPAPEAVEDVFLVPLHGDHHAVRHALGAHVVVFDVRDVSHVVAHLEIHFVGPEEETVERRLQFGVDVSLCISHLGEEVAVLSCDECALFPWQHVESYVVYFHVRSFNEFGLDIVDAHGSVFELEAHHLPSACGGNLQVGGPRLCGCSGELR